MENWMKVLFFQFTYSPIRYTVYWIFNVFRFQHENCMLGCWSLVFADDTVVHDNIPIEYFKFLFFSFWWNLIFKFVYYSSIRCVMFVYLREYIPLDVEVHFHKQMKFVEYGWGVSSLMGTLNAIWFHIVHCSYADGCVHKYDHAYMYVCPLSTGLCI